MDGFCQPGFRERGDTLGGFPSARVVAVNVAKEAPVARSVCVIWPYYGQLEPMGEKLYSQHSGYPEVVYEHPELRKSRLFSRAS